MNKNEAPPSYCTKLTQEIYFQGMANTREMSDPTNKLRAIEFTQKRAQVAAGVILEDIKLSSELVLRGMRGNMEIEVHFGRVTPLGKGGMNEVFIGTERISGKRCVLRKFLPQIAEALNKEEEVEIRKEIEECLLSLESFPHASTFWFRGKDSEGNEYGVWDMAEGVTLESYYHNHPLTYGKWLDLSLQLTRAVAYYHRHHIVHDDIKPENIIIDASAEKFHTQLIDMDLAKTPDHCLRLAKIGVIFGTPYFMSPESFNPDNIIYAANHEVEKLVQARDVYALGIALHKTLTGRELHREFGQAHGLIFPDIIPSCIKEGLLQACASDWRLRPSMREFILMIKKWKHLDLGDQLDTIIALAIPLSSQKKEAPETKKYRQINSDYHEVNEKFGEFMDGDHNQKYLALLEDRWGRKLIGIPHEFETTEEAQEFLKNRKKFIHDINRVREKHHELFPGVFDVVPEMEAKKVWIIRPYLEKRTLAEHCKIESISLEERKKIMLDIARSLAVIEEAGYVHPGLNMNCIYMVPYSAEQKRIAHQTTDSQHPQNNESVHETMSYYQSGHRLEVVNTSQSQKKQPGIPDANIKRFFSIGKNILWRKISPELAACGTWKEIVEFLEKQN